MYVVALALAVALAGPGQAAPAGSSGASVSKPAVTQQVKQQAQPQLPDAQIERNIRAKLAKSKMSGTEHFTVTVHNGVAFLEGKTDVIQHKGVATRLAKNGGAIAVKNNIQVSDAAKAKAAARLSQYRMPPTGPVRATVVQAK